MTLAQLLMVVLVVSGVLIWAWGLRQALLARRWHLVIAIGGVLWMCAFLLFLWVARG